MIFYKVFLDNWKDKLRLCLAFPRRSHDMKDVQKNDTKANERIIVTFENICSETRFNILDCVSLPELLTSQSNFSLFSSVYNQKPWKKSLLAQCVCVCVCDWGGGVCVMNR